MKLIMHNDVSTDRNMYLTLPVGLAYTIAVDGITSHRILFTTIAFTGTVRAIVIGVTSQITEFAMIAGIALAFACPWVTRCPIRTCTLLGTVLSIEIYRTWSIADLTLPSWRTETLSRLRVTFGPVLAIAFVLTILAREALLTRSFTMLSHITGCTEARTVCWGTEGVILAVTFILTIPTKFQKRAATITYATAPARLTFTFSRPRMASVTK